MNHLNLTTGSPLASWPSLTGQDEKLILSTIWASQTCWVGFPISLILKDCVKILEEEGFPDGSVLELNCLPVQETGSISGPGRSCMAWNN